MKASVVLTVCVLLNMWFGRTDANCSPCDCFKRSVENFRQSFYFADCRSRHLTKVPSTLPVNIEYLDLSDNELLEIALEDLQFPKLRILSLANNHLGRLPAELFQNVTGLEQLELHGNRITGIPEELFSHTPSIRKVISLHSVKTPAKLFHSTHKLRNLSLVLEDNAISPQLFQATSLSALDVSFTNTEVLPRDMLAPGSTTLRQIRLTGRKLTSLHQDLFANLTQVELIHINVESVEELPLHIFHGTHEYLDSQMESLQGIDQKFRDIIINNIMTSMQTTNARLREITVAGVKHVHSHLFHYLVNLQILSIRRAHSVDHNTFQGLIRLDKLELSHMNLMAIDSLWFHDLVGLKVLNLSHNSLSDIHNVGFSHLHSLDTLDLSHNRFSFVNSEDLDSFRNYLKYIDFSFNQIRYLPSGILMDTYALEEVRLQGNRIEEISEQHFTGIEDAGSENYQSTLIHTELRNFDMSSNNLHELQLDVFLQMGSIVVLNLAHNHISNVSINNFPNQINIATFSLIDNPVYCSCEFVSFLELCRRFKSNVLGHCQEPASLRGIPFAEVTIPEECFETVKELLEEVTTEGSFTTELMEEITTEIPLTVFPTSQEQLTAEVHEQHNLSSSFEITIERDSNLRFEINPAKESNSTFESLTSVTNESISDEMVSTNLTEDIGVFQNASSNSTAGKRQVDIEDTYSVLGETVGRSASHHPPSERNHRETTTFSDAGSNTVELNVGINKVDNFIENEDNILLVHNSSVFDKGFGDTSDSSENIIDIESVSEVDNGSGGSGALDDINDVGPSNDVHTDVENDLTADEDQVMEDAILQHEVRQETSNQKQSTLGRWVAVAVGTVGGVASVPATIWFIVKMRGYLYKRNYFTFERRGKNVV